MDVYHFNQVLQLVKWAPLTDIPSIFQQYNHQNSLPIPTEEQIATLISRCIDFRNDMYNDCLVENDG